MAKSVIRYLNQLPHRRWQGNFLLWRLTHSAPAWQQRFTPGFPKPPARLASHELRATFIGHSTVLLQTGGLNFLTDPVWSERVLGFRRFRAPGLPLADLPPIDGVLLSHNHFDHLDVPTLQALRRRQPDLRIFAGRGVGETCPALRNFQLTELPWWGNVSLNAQTALHFVPARHSSRRGVWDANRSLWGGFVVANGDQASYFAGDTGFGPHFEAIKKHFPHLRLAILPIGAYAPPWFWRPVHMSPEEALQAHRILKPTCSLAVHYGTFRLTNEAQDEPPMRLQAALAPHERNTFWVLEHGEGRDVPGQAS